MVFLHFQHQDTDLLRQRLLQRQPEVNRVLLMHLYLYRFCYSFVCHQSVVGNPSQGWLRIKTRISSAKQCSILLLSYIVIPINLERIERLTPSGGKTRQYLAVQLIAPLLFPNKMEDFDAFLQPRMSSSSGDCSGGGGFNMMNFMTAIALVAQLLINIVNVSNNNNNNNK